MNTITLEGKEYILRCDLNAYEEIAAKYGDIDTAANLKDDTTGKMKALLTILINEHYYYVGAAERITEKQIGAMLTPGDTARVYKALMETINEAFAPKN